MPDKPNAEPPVGDVGVLQAWQRTITDAVRDAYAALPDAPEPPEATVAVRAMAAELTELRPLRAKVTELSTKVKEQEPLVADGTAYRTAMVDATWGEYVRAGLADGVVEEEQKALWRSVPLAQVLKEQASYRKLGDVRYPGGRLTTEGEAAPAPAPQHEYPLAAYAV